MTSESGSVVVSAKDKAIASQSLASTSRARLDRLPSEVQLRIFSQMGLETADHLALRATCKRVKGAAELAMLSSLTVGPQTTWDVGKLAGVPALSKLVRTITFNTRDFGEDEWELGQHDDGNHFPPLEEEADCDDYVIDLQPWRKPVSSDFLLALGAAGRFPNVAGVVVRFSVRGSSGTWDNRVMDDMIYPVDWSQWAQNFWFRRPILREFLTGLGGPHGVAAERGLDICLDNVQNINPAIMWEPEVRTALGRLAALRLYIVTEICSGEEHLDLERDELHTFMADLPAVWLNPASASPNLTTLVLYQDRPFGYFPRLSLSGVHFPHLKTLALGNFTFSHPHHQLDFFASHAATLENLYLDHPVLIYYSIYPRDRCNADGYPHRPPWDTDIPEDELSSLTAFSPRLTFADILSRIETSLPNLVRFSLGRSARYPISAYSSSDEYCHQPHPCLHPPHERIKAGVDRNMYRGCIIYRWGDPPLFRNRMREEYRRLTIPERLVLMGEATDWWEEWEDYVLEPGLQVVEDNEALAGLVRRLGLRRAERALAGGRVVSVEESTPPDDETAEETRPPDEEAEEKGGDEETGPD